MALPTPVPADASSYGIGGVLYSPDMPRLRKNVWQASGLVKIFKKCLIDLENFKLVTDHKPLVPLMNEKDFAMSETTYEAYEI